MKKIILGVTLAVGFTALLDATGYSMLSALPLIPLFAVFAWWDRLSLREIGFVGGTSRDHLLALGLPVLVMTILTAVAYMNGAVDFSAIDPGKAGRNVALLATITFVMAMITEEGFFRGWMWGALARRGASAAFVLALTTAAFAIWHVPFVYLSTEFQFARESIPIYFANVVLLGLIWGLLRLASGSIVVASAAHALWNGLTYVLFGVGDRPGMLGIRDVALYGPEVGLYGLLLNGLVAAGLVWVLRGKIAARAMSPQTA